MYPSIRVKAIHLTTCFLLTISMAACTDGPTFTFNPFATPTPLFDRTLETHRIYDYLIGCQDGTVVFYVIPDETVDRRFGSYNQMYDKFNRFPNQPVTFFEQSTYDDYFRPSDDYPVEFDKTYDFQAKLDFDSWDELNGLN